MYSPLNSYVYIHWILDFKYILLSLNTIRSNQLAITIASLSANVLHQVSPLISSFLTFTTSQSRRTEKMAMEKMAMEKMAMEQMAMEIMVMEKMAMEIMAFPFHSVSPPNYYIHVGTTCLHLAHHLDLHPVSIKHALEDIKLSSNTTLNIHSTITSASLSLKVLQPVSPLIS